MKLIWSCSLRELGMECRSKGGASPHFKTTTICYASTGLSACLAQQLSPLGKKTSYTHAALSCISKLGAIFNEAYKSPLKLASAVFVCASAYSPAVKSCLHLGLDWQIILASSSNVMTIVYQLSFGFFFSCLHFHGYLNFLTWIHDDKLKGDSTLM